MIQKITIKNYRSIKEVTINLQNYSLFVGANNTGKSNILQAIYLFLDSKGKPEKEDFCHLVTDNRMQISVFIDDIEIVKEWDKNKISVAKLSPENKEILDQYIPIYIPTIEKIEDTTKTSSTNIFGKLLQTITESFEDYDKYKKIVELVNEINIDSTNPIKKLEEELNGVLGTSFTSHLSPSITTNLQALDLFKSINMQFKDENGKIVDSSSIGSGMQRTLIYNLIMLLNKTSVDKKYILLYDEPEVCLHPSQQKILAYHLKHELSKEMQIILSSHSSIFAISGIDQINSIIRSEFTNDVGTKIYQISSLEDIKNIYKSTFTETTEYLDPYRYINWFNQERGQLFFAKGVLLVEGLTEKGLFEFLSENHEDWHFLQKNHIYVLDCCGKHEMIRWGEIVKKLNIPFGIISELDNNKIGRAHV